MKSTYLLTIATMIIATMIMAPGCGKNAAPSGDSEPKIVMDSDPPASADSFQSHAHAPVGPHDGTLIELGNEKYHAEVVHDQKSLTIYILDGSATQPTPIDAAEVTVNLVHDGKPTQFKVPASPDANDPSGRSSRFTVQNSQLIQSLEQDHAGAKLNVRIDGKSHLGEIRHDHEGHDHAH